MSKDAAQLRQEILRIDEEILDRVRKRVELAERVGRLKAQQGEPVQNFAIEKQVLEHARSYGTKAGLALETVDRLVEAWIRAALRVQERDRVRTGAGRGRKALVVGGAGRMGQWFARFLAESGHDVHVLDPAPHAWTPGDPKTHSYDLAILAVPPSQVVPALDSLMTQLPAECLVVDLASIKGEATARLRHWAGQGRRIASLHPLFGPNTDLLRGHNVLVLDCGNPDAVDQAEALFAATTAATHRLDLDEHDALMSHVLGLAHALSLLFNQYLTEADIPWARMRSVASTTFARQADVSREVATENPSLYHEVQARNPHTPKMLDRLQAALETLRAAIQDPQAFTSMMESARAYYAKEEA